jgi:hypothetical protein
LEDTADADSVKVRVVVSSTVGGFRICAAFACYDCGRRSMEENMRILALTIITLVLGAGPASAWEEYNYPDQGVAIQFPAKPQAMKSTRDSTLAKGLPAMIYSVEDDHVLYRLTVVDLTSRPDTGSNFLNEAAYGLMREGDVLFTDFPRVYQDAKSIYGVTLVVDRMDGSRVRSSLYYHKGRLYIAGATVLPARHDKDMATPSRYDQTIRFPPDGRFD